MGNAAQSRSRPRPARRRWLPAALAGSAWQLAAACAAIFAAAFFGALAISFFLRPTRRYLFPLLTDIDAHHPESAILRSGTFLATVLLCATAAAAFATVSGSAPESSSAGGGAAAALADDELMSEDSEVSDDEFRELRDMDGVGDGESLIYVGGDTSVTSAQTKAANRQEANRVLRQLRQRLAVATRTNRRALLLVAALSLAIAAMLYQGGTSRLSLVTGTSVAGADELEVAAPVANVKATADAMGNVGAAAAAQRAGSGSAEAGASPSAVVLLYSASAIWTGLLMYLVWFFLRLQSTACSDLPASSDDDLMSEVAEATAAGNTSDAYSSPLLQLPSGSISYITLASVSTSITTLSASVSSSVLTLQTMESNELWLLCVQRGRAACWRAVAFVRPICLIAQVVSVIKIVGLLYALNCFTIAKIRLINTTLLAALAFAEYTAAFFVSFFLIILAVDMRRAAEDELWISRLKLGLPSNHRHYVSTRTNVSIV